MSQQIYRTVIGNNAPDLVITCQRNGTAINITGATVKLMIQNERTGITTNGSNQSCALTTPASGIITYSPALADFPQEGRYVASIEITYASGKIEEIREEVLIIVRGGIS